MTIGAWTAWPKSGTARHRPLRAGVDRAHRRTAGRNRRRRRLLRPRRRQRGTPFDGRCTFVISGFDAGGALLDAHALRSEGRPVGEHHRPARLHQPGDRARSGRQLRDQRRAARAAGQLAADRRDRAITCWCGASTIRRSAWRRARRSPPMPAVGAKGLLMIRCCCGSRRPPARRHRPPVDRAGAAADGDAGRLFAARAAHAGQCRGPAPAADCESALMPFMDPAFAVAVCRYDISSGPLKFRRR